MDKKKTKSKLSKVKKIKKPVKVDTGKYTLKIYVNNEVFESKTDDVQKTLRKFKPTKITNKVKITLEEGKKYAERVMMVYSARRTFSQPLATEFVAKNLILRLK